MARGGISGVEGSPGQRPEHPVLAVVVTPPHSPAGFRQVVQGLAGQTDLSARSTTVFAAPGDRAAAVAAAFEAVGDGAIALHLFQDKSASTPNADCREVLEAATYHLRRRAGGSDPVLLVLGSDAVPAPDWVASNLRALKSGADVVCGQPLLASRFEARRLPPNVDALLRHRRLVTRLEELLDPVPWDPAPRHGDESGASYALRLSTLEAAGGVPNVPAHIHRHLIARVRQSGGVVRHCPRTRVFVRPSAFGAFASFEAEGQTPDLERPILVSDPHELEQDFRNRARIRDRLKRHYAALAPSEQDRAVRSHLALGTPAVTVSPRGVPVEEACSRLRKRLEQLGAPCAGGRVKPGLARVRAAEERPWAW